MIAMNIVGLLPAATLTTVEHMVRDVKIYMYK